jgi:outer membrane protein assembly factor BamB
MKMIKRKAKTIFIRLLCLITVAAIMPVLASGANQVPVEKLWTAVPEKAKPVFTIMHGQELLLFTDQGFIERRGLTSGKLLSRLKAGIVPASRPLMAGQTALIAGRDESLYALDLVKGKILWKQEDLSDQFSSPVLHEGVVYIGLGNRSGGVLGFSLNDGKKVFSLPMKQSVVSAPLILDNRLLFGTTHGRLYTADLSKGLVLDSISTLGEFFGQDLVPFQNKHLLISPTGHHGKVECLNLAQEADKTIEWSFSYKRDVYLSSKAFNEVTALPPNIRDYLLRKYLVRVPLFKKRAFDMEQDFLASGPVHTSSWTVLGENACIVVKETGYFSKGLYHVLLVDIKSGKELMQYERLSGDGGRPFCVPPIVTEDIIIAVIGRGEVVCLNKKEGEVLWEYKLNDDVPVPMVKSDYYFAVQTKRGQVTAFRYQKPGLLPKEFAVQQNVPNPFNPFTLLNYQVPKNTFVSLKIFNIRGQEIVTLVNSNKKAGFYKVTWDGRGAYKRRIPSGVYFAVFKAGTYTKNIKMTLVK